MKGLSTKKIGVMLGAIVIVALVSTYFEPLKATLRVKDSQ